MLPTALSDADLSSGRLHPNDYRPIFDELLDMHVQRWQEIDALPLSKWIIESREIAMAMQRVFLGRRGRKANTAALLPIGQWNESEWRSFAERRFQQSLAMGLSSEGSDPELEYRSRYAFYLKFRYDFMEPVYPSRWLVRTVNALHEYFTGEAAADILRMSKEFAAAAREAEKAIGRYVSLASDYRAYGLKKSGTFDKGIIRRLAAEGFPAPPPSSYPITRNDPHANEKLFVFRMNKINREFTGVSKPEAIAMLMLLPGFKHQYELRHIERLCTQFTDKFEPGRPRNESGQV